jgi:hypothetical protein
MSSEEKPVEKLPYTSPKLTIYSNITVTTATKNRAGADGGALQNSHSR